MLQLSLVFVLVSSLLLPGVSVAAALDADVVVVVDTSFSMTEPGMDPERTSLLVSHLFADLVPGELSTVRLLDYSSDVALLPSKQTGETKPCVEDPSRSCQVIVPDGDWGEMARRGRYGVLERPVRGDVGYRGQLASHLEQVAGNSDFGLAFAAAQGVFDEHARSRGSSGDAHLGRTVVWLSDGRSNDDPAVIRRIGELVADGASVHTVLFGRGDPGLATRAGLTPLRTSSPPELMKAFAGIFRHIVGAPYELDGRVASQPEFDMKPHVDEAWVVVYGDATLSSVYVDGPQGRVDATYASSSWPSAGAYHVAHLTAPTTGSWSVHPTGGGSDVAYAVVQRSDITPALLEPHEAIAGSEVAVVAGLRAGVEGELLILPDVLSDFELTAEIEGQSVRLLDDGTGLDSVAGDGRFTGPFRFVAPGSVTVSVRARSELVDRATKGVVEVSSLFEHRGPPIEVDLGSVGVDEETCQPFPFTPRHEGAVELELRSLASVPAGHRLEVRSQGQVLVADGRSAAVGPGAGWELCLITSPRVPSSMATGEPWLELGVAGSDAPQHQVTLMLSWEVSGLPWWLRWLWLLVGLALLAVTVFVAAGYVLPKRFSRNLAVVIVQDEEDLDEQRPLPMRTFRGVGIGFYRNARAYILTNFRVSGKARGAVARLQQESNGLCIYPEHGTALFRETDGDWELVPERGRRAYKGDIYRVGEGTLYFRITTS